jgi:hypothetical protein
LSELTQAIILLNKIGWGWTDIQTTMIDLLKTDEDDDSKWCICGHHIVSHIEDGTACKDKFCYGNCKEFIPCTILSAQECLKRYRLLLAVLRERFVIKNSKILSLFDPCIPGSDFREIIDKRLHLEEIDIYQLRNFVVRKIMKKNNLQNLDELDGYLKRFHKLARPLIYSKAELSTMQLYKLERKCARETKRAFKKLMNEELSSIYVTSEKLSIKHHIFENISLEDFLTALIEAPLARRDFVKLGKEGGGMKSYNGDNNHNRYPNVRNNKHFSAERNQKITVKRLFERLNFSITDNTIVIADIGDSLFGALDLTIHGQTDFLSPAYYLSMGFAVPAAIGAQLANPKLRPIVIVGDGAFQMTGMEISTIARFNLNPIVIILNNKGYVTERPMLDGPFNDVLPWNYSQIPDIIGGHGKGFVVETEDQLEESLSAVEKIYSQELCMLDVHLDKHDGSPALQRLTEVLGKKVQ